MSKHIALCATLIAACASDNPSISSLDGTKADGPIPHVDIVVVDEALARQFRQQTCAVIREAHPWPDRAAELDFASRCFGLNLQVVRKVFSNQFLNNDEELSQVLFHQQVRVQDGDTTYRVIVERRFVHYGLIWTAMYLRTDAEACEGLSDMVTDCVLDSGSLNGCIPDTPMHEEFELATACCEQHDDCITAASFDDSDF
jgi:hypothetical protein